MALRIGTSGWHYKDWRGTFYPERLATREWLSQYARSFDTVEVNNTFYRLPPPSTFAAWRQQTPDDFVFVVKASRFLTHYKRLRDPQEPVDRLLACASALKDKLGPVLLQLPASFSCTLDRLEAVLAAFDGRSPVACEFRHPSWFCDEVYEVLEAHNAALCLTDRRNRRSPIVRTASWFLLRLHEGTAKPAPCYGDRALAAWVDRLRSHFDADAQGFVFFNNDHLACAARNAVTFQQLAINAGLDVLTVGT